ncbi:MAG: hypothetical protein WAM60_00295, partial [Candidatus Promineifilaceae bacterium]
MRAKTMKMKIKVIQTRLTLLVLVCSSFVFLSEMLFAQEQMEGIYFDDSGVDIIVGADDYEIAFRKQNGGIVYIKDKATGQQVSGGSLNGCLWVIVFDYSAQDYIESCSYAPTSANHFSYTWLANTGQLVMNFDPDPTAPKSVDVIVRMTASANNWFDLQISVTNDWGYVPEDVKFPSDLVFGRADMQEALLPVLPGVVLKSGFFNRGLTYEADYPGAMAADFISVNSTKGHIAMYAIPVSDRITPARFGFFFQNCTNTTTVCLTHNIKSGVKDGASWSSPLMRIRLNESYFDTVNAFRTDTNIDAFASIEDKLGGLYQQVIRSPLYKADLGGIPFNDVPNRLATEIPYPGILHLVAYWQRGFDENYPDFLPPDPNLGTPAEMVAMMQASQNMGYLMMPYINPTWWDDESPTIQDDLPPLSIEDIAVLDK